MRLTQLAAATALAGCLATPVYAQSASSGGQEARLSEIIVTARKRQEAILNVPVIETAISQEQLQRLQTRDLKDLSKFTPGLLMGTGASNAGTQLSLRGVGTTTQDPAIEQTVALNIDGVQMTQGLAFLTGMFDVGQVEVLKGPQSLFYGKGAPGGVISLRTADPTNEVEVIGRAMYEFEARARQGELIVSGPVADGLKVRLAGMYSREDGYFYNVGVPLTSTGALTPSRRAGPATVWIFRSTVLWDPVDAFSARLKVSLNNNRSFYTTVGQMTSCPEGTGAPLGIPFLGGGEDCKLDRTMRVVNMNPAFYPTLWNDGRPELDTTQKYGSLELNWTPRPEITLTSVTGYYWARTHAVTPGTSPSFAASPIDVLSLSGRRDWTEEVRLNTEFEGPLNVTAGLFYQDSLYWSKGLVGGSRAYGLPTVLFSSPWDLHTKSVSPFAQLRWRPMENLEVALGARYTDEKRRVATMTAAGVPIPLAVPRIRSKTTAPELTVTYKPTDDVTVFGSLKKGFKSGSFNLGIAPFPGADNSYGDERVKGGEIGVKSRLLDRRLSLEAAYFDYRYTGLQVGVIELIAGTPQTRTVNAGSARTYGVEFSSAWRPEQVEGLDLFVNGQWNSARFKTLDNISCYGGQTIALGCDLQFSPAANNGLGGFTAQNLNGIPMIRAPKWQVNFGFNYEASLPDGKAVVFSNNNAYYSRHLLVLGKRPDFYSPSYFKTDLSVALHGRDDRWELALIGKNIADKIIRASCSNSNYANGGVFGGQLSGRATGGPAGVDEVQCRADRGREVWLRLSLKR